MHKSSRIFSIILCLLQAICLAKQDSDVVEHYFDITDCGNGSILYISMSITPYPLFIIQPLNVWIGGQILCSEKAQEFTQNMTFDYFNQNLNSTFFIDNSLIELPQSFLSLLQHYNNTRATGELMDERFMKTIFRAIEKGIRYSSVFIGVGVNTASGDILFHSFLDWLLHQLDIFKPIFIQLRIKLVLNTTEVLCVRFNVRTKKNEALDYDPKALVEKNYALAFETPSYKNREGKLVCPAGSIQSTNSSSTCLCAVPHSGPFCQFQCTQAQVDGDGYALCGGTDTICEFSASDYANGCLNTHHVPVLNGNITVNVPNLETVNVQWQVRNFFSYYNYIIRISGTGHEQKFQYRAIYGDGLPIEVNIEWLQQHDGNGESPLNIKPFTTYPDFLNAQRLKVLSLEFSIKSIGSNPSTVYAGSVHFTTPEITPTQVPEITAARLQKNEVNIDWMLPGQCPGMIIFYDIKILCNEKTSDSQNQPGNSGNISFDCRSHINGTMLVGYVPVNCQESRNLKVQLRVGTISGMSNFSKLFEIPDSNWPPVVIAAVALGGILISVLVAAVGFYYYYKRHVQDYQSVYKMLNSLLKSRRPGGIGQSFRRLSHQNRSLPNPPITLKSESSGTTRFEPTPDVYSPRSPASPANNMLEDDYTTGTFFHMPEDELSNPHSKIASIYIITV